MILDDIVGYLSGRPGCGTAGAGPTSDLWAGLMPDTDDAPDLCTQVSEYGGMMPEVRFGADGVYREYPRLQFVTRSNVRDYASGRTRIETIKKTIALVNLPGLINGVMYHNLKVLQSPFWMMTDAKWREHFAFNVQFYKDPIA